MFMCTSSRAIDQAKRPCLDPFPDAGEPFDDRVALPIGQDARRASMRACAIEPSMS